MLVVLFDTLTGRLDWTLLLKILSPAAGVIVLMLLLAVVAGLLWLVVANLNARRTAPAAPDAPRDQPRASRTVTLEETAQILERFPARSGSR